MIARSGGRARSPFAFPRGSTAERVLGLLAQAPPRPSTPTAAAVERAVARGQEERRAERAWLSPSEWARALPSTEARWRLRAAATGVRAVPAERAVPGATARRTVPSQAACSAAPQIRPALHQRVLPPRWGLWASRREEL